MNVKKSLLVLAFAALVALMVAMPVWADTVNGSAGVGWQSWTVTDLNQNGTPYWDRTA